jgi:hypothetical protein
MTIDRKDSEEIREILSRIRSLFDQYYELNHSAPAEDDLVGKLYDEVDELRACLWHKVDPDTAQIMDDEDGFERPISQSRHQSVDPG